VKARKVKHLAPDGRLDENAARIVLVRLAELRDLAPKALKPKASKAQHDLRIAAKRLRYVLEVTGFCFGEPADAARRSARDLQDVLGEIHDCDVMLPRVLTHLEELRADDAAELARRAGDAPDLDPRLTAEAPNRTAYRGLEMLAVNLTARRRVLFEHFLRSWAEEEQRGTWNRLEQTAKATLEPSPSSREASPIRSTHPGTD
jgi:hypothetical protein